MNFSLSSPIGEIGFCLSENALESIDFSSQKHVPDIENDLARLTAGQLNAYFENPNVVFDIPLRVIGTTFQQRVWSALRAIPAGETRSYGELAKSLKSSPRAVGNACRRNPLPIVI
ncbi:MAG: methylated-DNA--[protein]-cysteine S-methyltransferase, partial [Gammaproteobacteria bacterium]|nr:methylated-DNA--[protein]-cysteine S-methyltransferase [Gammaproteobacteria bacterium]